MASRSVSVLMPASLLPRPNSRSTRVTRFTGGDLDESCDAFGPLTMTAITIGSRSPGNFPRFRGKYGHPVGRAILTWQNSRMRGSGVRLVARRHVDYKRVCSACCLPGSHR
ncbi:Ms4527A family Cys-rich leader peptide [Nocardia sp. CA-084685]|uniref:Ms4527A family Cys-rich leader peptide n=1 Tax=Nocardia sp. CA-084685 TaxID=3239970 RepID=UPI003D999627